MELPLATKASPEFLVFAGALPHEDIADVQNASGQHISQANSARARDMADVCGTHELFFAEPKQTHVINVALHAPKLGDEPY